MKKLLSVIAAAITVILRQQGKLSAGTLWSVAVSLTTINIRRAMNRFAEIE